MTDSLFLRACAQAHLGMEISVIAAEQPARIALWCGEEQLSFAQLNARVNQLVRRMRLAGLQAGDAVAMVCSNCIEFAVVRFATHRAGLRLTPINWHLAPQDMFYIVENCEARALFIDSAASALAEPVCTLEALRLRVAIGTHPAGFMSWEAALEGMDASNIADPVLGSTMLYTSGTTGRPKGVYRRQPDPKLAAHMQQILTQVFQFQPDTGNDRALATGPLYHAGPLGLCLTTPLTAGIGTVIMKQWAPQAMLALLAEHRITHTFCVPTMFTRLLQLPASTRASYDLGSLRFVIHGAAPCSLETKRAMLDWLGPVLWEMFAGTEGAGTIVSPQEWLAKPGTVGRPSPGQVRILDESGEPVGANVPGTIYLLNHPGSRFEYFNDPAKTADALRDTHFTAGDIGYLDEDGYLFLTGRSAEVIISGGINLYPQEIDDVLARHPAVCDVACVGVPNSDLGEEVRAVLSLRPGFADGPELRTSIMDFCVRHLSKQKWPRSLEVVDEVPRSEAGKVLRSQIRSNYWVGQSRAI